MTFARSTIRSAPTVATVLAGLLLTGCGGADDPAATGDGDQTEATDDTGTEDSGDEGDGDAEATEDDGASMDGGVLATADTELGTVLADGEGMTLYLFDNDSDGESACYDSCAETWPPLTGEVSAGEGVDASLIGTTERTDGTTQVTYDGNPLYYYAADSGAGDTNGQGVGGVWWVVGPDGSRITDDASASSDGIGY
jgi:predicted lipoprotein with Yx(FWY)xxD motif